MNKALVEMRQQLLTIAKARRAAIAEVGQGS